MGRALRIQVENGTYHIVMEAARGLSFFLDAEDRVRFLRILGYVVTRYGWKLHAYCLLTTHYHLVVTTPDANLAQGMHVLNGVYVTSFNKRYERRGHLKGARYKSKLIENEDYALEVSRYVPLNSVRAGLCDLPELWLWSSYAATVGLRRKPSFVDDGWLLALFSTDPVAARAAYRAWVEVALAEAA